MCNASQRKKNFMRCVESFDIHWYKKHCTHKTWDEDILYVHVRSKCNFEDTHDGTIQ